MLSFFYSKLFTMLTKCHAGLPRKGSPRDQSQTERPAIVALGFYQLDNLLTPTPTHTHQWHSTKELHVIQWHDNHDIYTTMGVNGTNLPSVQSQLWCYNNGSITVMNDS